MARGHRTSVFCADPADFLLWSRHGFAAVCIPAEPGPCSASTLEPFVEIDQRLRPAAWPLLHLTRRRLARLWRGASSLLDQDRPDLVVFHQQRTGAHALLHFVAKSAGCRVLWTGDGLFPGTIQIDECGLDGDARISRRVAWDFRAASADPGMAEAALAAIAGQNRPLALERRPIQPLPQLSRLRAALQGLGRGTAPGFWAALQAAKRAAGPSAPMPQGDPLPTGPLVAVLLQAPDDPRLRLDAERAPDAPTLTMAAAAAARACDPALTPVALMPEGGLPRRELAALRRLGIPLASAQSAAPLCMAAALAITVNSPAAATALLCETPVVRLGRAVYGIPGITASADLGSLADGMRAALQEDQPELRRRFLGWLLQYGHVWCAADAPDFNGLNGLIQQVERRLADPPPLDRPLSYRTGPAWPLHAEGR
jgi:hypothetical protein